MSNKEIIATGSRVILWVWIAGTMIFNMPGDQAKLQRLFSRVGLGLPTWKFFAPTPATTDLVLMYRDRSDHEAVTPWKAVDINRARGRSMVWPPPGRDRKAYVDLAQELRSVCVEYDNALPVVRESPVYAHTVRYLQNLPALSQKPEAREFMIVEAHTSIDHPSVTPIFTSAAFPLSPGDVAAPSDPVTSAAVAE